MPVSKVRKKKKKKSSNDNRDREVFQKDGMSFIREGENIFIKNNRTPEEHANFVAELQKNRPNIFKSIEDSINRVITIFENYNKFSLLGALSSYHLNSQDSTKDDSGPEIIMEYGQSFATALPNNASTIPTNEIINELIGTLLGIHNAYQNYIMSEFADGKYSELEYALRYKTINEALFVRGIGYVNHIYSLYRELFTGHDAFLREKYNFTSGQILDTILQLEDSFCCRIVYKGGPHPAQLRRFDEWAADNNIILDPRASGQIIKQFAEANPDFYYQNNSIVNYRLDNIEVFEKLFKIRFRYPYQKLVTKAISMEFGDNIEFLNDRSMGFPLSESKILTHPIIAYNDEFYLFAFALPTRNLIELTENLIKRADNNYYKTKYLGNKYSKSRDNFLETKSGELFSKIISDAHYFPNVKYRVLSSSDDSNSETELDLLIISKNANYLVEMKAGGLSAPSKRGALRSLSGQLKETVGYGSYQNFRALEFIQNSENPIFVNNLGYEIPIDKSKKTFRITITLEHLGDLIAYMYDLKELGIFEENVDFAWTCSIFDLMVFSEIIESEQDFIDYLDKRIPFYKRSELLFIDELDLLGHFLDHDLNLDEKMISGLTHFQLDRFSSDITKYFEHGGEKPTRKGKRL